MQKINRQSGIEDVQKLQGNNSQGNHPQEYHGGQQITVWETS